MNPQSQPPDGFEFSVSAEPSTPSEDRVADLEAQVGVLTAELLVRREEVLELHRRLRTGPGPASNSRLSALYREEAHRLYDAVLDSRAEVARLGDVLRAQASPASVGVYAQADSQKLVGATARAERAEKELAALRDVVALANEQNDKLARRLARRRAKLDAGMTALRAAAALIPPYVMPDGAEQTLAAVEAMEEE